jgi:methionyl-tRNA formyltransferase
MNNFIFFGTPLFSKIILEKLINNNFLPKALITNPDRPVGRKKIITPPETKSLILEKKLENQIKIFQPENLNDNFINEIKNLRPEFGIICAYSKIIPNVLLNLFPKGILGVHPSLLPKYRGASPIQSAILNGEKESGITIYLLDDKMDHGPILIQEKINIENLYYNEALIKLANLGGDLLIKILPNFYQNKINPISQNENLATYTKKFKTEDGFINSNDLEKAQNEGGAISFEIYNKIRALSFEPGVWTILNNKRMKIFEAEIIDSKLKLKKIQFEGQKIKNLIN